MNPIKSAILQNSRYGVKDRCLSFDGTDDKVELEEGVLQALFNGKAAITYEFWAYQQALRTGTDRNTIFVVLLGATSVTSIFYYNQGNMVFIGRSGAGDGGTVFTVAGGVLQTWQHIALIQDFANSRWVLYVDGVHVNNYTVTNWANSTFVDPGLSTNYNSIGDGFNAARFFNGKIDEFRIWNHVRAADQIKRYMNVRLTGKETGLVAYYPMDEGTGSTAFDKSPNGNNGIISGATWIKP